MLGPQATISAGHQITSSNAVDQTGLPRFPPKCPSGCAPWCGDWGTWTARGTSQAPCAKWGRIRPSPGIPIPARWPLEQRGTALSGLGLTDQQELQVLEGREGVPGWAWAPPFSKERKLMDPRLPLAVVPSRCSAQLSAPGFALLIQDRM